MKIKSKKILLIPSLVAAILVILWLRPQSIYEAYHVNRQDITKIKFFDLRNKPSNVTITDKNKINEFLKYIDKFKIAGCRPNFFNSNDINVINFYINDKLVIKMCPTSTSTFSINGYEYNTYKNGLAYEIVTNFINAK